MEINYKDDKREGLAKLYSETGELLSEIYFINNEPIK